MCPPVKRVALLRKSELRSKARPRSHAHKDPVTPELREYVLARDGGCVAPRLEMERQCFGRLEIDHVLNGGVGKRGPSMPSNLVTLCGQHHYSKTVAAKVWRPVLLRYLMRVEPMA